MQTLAHHDLDTLIGILTRLRKAHGLMLAAPLLAAEERRRLSDEIAVLDRLMPVVTAAFLATRTRDGKA